MKKIILLAVFTTATIFVGAQKSINTVSLKSEAINSIDQKYEEYKKTA